MNWTIEDPRCNSEMVINHNCILHSSYLPRALNFVKKVGDFTQQSGKRTATRKNGTLRCRCHTLKKFDLSAINKSSALVFPFRCPEIGQRTEEIRQNCHQKFRSNTQYTRDWEMGCYSHRLPRTKLKTQFNFYSCIRLMSTLNCWSHFSCIPLGWSDTGSTILDHGASKELMNLPWECNLKSYDSMLLKLRNLKSYNSTILNCNFLSCINYKSEWHQSMSDCPPGCCVNYYLPKNFVFYCLADTLVIVRIFYWPRQSRDLYAHASLQCKQTCYWYDHCHAPFLLILYECSRVHSCVQTASECNVSKGRRQVNFTRRLIVDERFSYLNRDTTKTEYSILGVCYREETTTLGTSCPTLRRMSVASPTS